MRRYNITEDTIESIKKAKEAGMEWKKASKVLGLPTSVVLSCWNGNPRDRRKRNFTLEEKYTAQELYKQGYTVAQIAIELGVSWHKARKLLDSLCLYD